MPAFAEVSWLFWLLPAAAQGFLALGVVITSQRPLPAARRADGFASAAVLLVGLGLLALWYDPQGRPAGTVLLAVVPPALLFLHRHRAVAARVAFWCAFALCFVVGVWALCALWPLWIITRLAHRHG